MRPVVQRFERAAAQQQKCCQKSVGCCAAHGTQCSPNATHCQVESPPKTATQEARIRLIKGWPRLYYLLLSAIAPCLQ
jgi:hypothetical protein